MCKLIGWLPVWLVLALTSASTEVLAQLADVQPGSAAAIIYGENHLKRVSDQTVLSYDYELSGTAIQKPFRDRVTLRFSRKIDDPGFDVTAVLFPGTRNQTIGPISARSINPILLIFFQRDVNQMSRGTGGSPHFFRNVIRKALQSPDGSTDADSTFTLRGRQITGQVAELMPFNDARNRTRMKHYARKVYRFVVANDVPGGVYEVTTEVPSMDSQSVMLRERYTYREGN